MKNLSLIILLTASILSAQTVEKKNVAVTIYNDNFGVVKDTRTVQLNKGNNTVKLDDVAQLIDATSVRIGLDGYVLEQNYQYDLVSLDKILQRYINRQISLIGEKDEVIEGTLLSASSSQVVLQKKDGGLVMLPNLSKYRISVDALPEGLITKPTLVVDLFSNKQGKQDVEFAYQTTGMSWRADYVVVLDKEDKKIDLNSWVTINNNSGSTYQNALLKLVAGDVNKVKSQQRGDYYYEDAYTKTTSAPNQFEQQEFFEYHLYQLQRPTTLNQNETKQLSLFEASNISVKKKYLYSSSIYGSGKKVNVVIEFENKQANNLGVPMPKGLVRLYKSDGASLEFIGEDQIDHTPKDEKLKLKIGDAFDIVAEEVQKDYKQISSRVTETTIEIKIKNRKKEDIVVDVQRYLGLNWEIVKTTMDYEKKSATEIIYYLPVKANSEATITYTVRYSY